MTETVNETAETVETKNVPAVEEFTSPLAALVVEKAKGVMEELKAVASKLAAAGNVGDLLSEAIKSSEDPKVRENLMKIEKANEAILTWMKENEAIVKPTLSVPTDEEIKALDESYKASVSNIKTLDTVFTNEVKAAYPDLTLYDYVGEMPKGRRGTTGAKAGQGEGTSRPRVSEIAVSTDNGQSYTKVEKDGKSTFSVVLQYLKKETGESISATDLHEAWFAQNGNVSNWVDLAEQTTFNYSLNDKSFMFRVTK